MAEMWADQSDSLESTWADKTDMNWVVSWDTTKAGLMVLQRADRSDWMMAGHLAI
jgi:hypothetical protein